MLNSAPPTYNVNALESQGTSPGLATNQVLFDPNQYKSSYSTPSSYNVPSSVPVPDPYYQQQQQPDQQQMMAKALMGGA